MVPSIAFVWMFRHLVEIVLADHVPIIRPGHVDLVIGNFQSIHHKTDDAEIRRSNSIDGLGGKVKPDASPVVVDFGDCSRNLYRLTELGVVGGPTIWRWRGVHERYTDSPRIWQSTGN